MTRSELRTAFLDELTRVAPDIEPSNVADDDHLQTDLELDSMDILNLVLALHDRLGVAIPEIDYRKIETLAKAESYLAEQLGQP